MKILIMSIISIIILTSCESSINQSPAISPIKFCGDDAEIIFNGLDTEYEKKGVQTYNAILLSVSVDVVAEDTILFVGVAGGIDIELTPYIFNESQNDSAWVVTLSEITGRWTFFHRCQ